ncbi:MAG: hypothetical protein Q8P68_05535 [Candidatus Peregrinibacteria bacterium]|nr:hypothetical protein [Candidatus Peregrinibacteria bacterium]MDZ4244349.1 hypothetical protein [Candidatus Gracilibacteria bacterium]
MSTESSMTQQEFFKLIDGIRKAGTPEHKPLKFKEISDLIGISRGRLFELLGLRKKTSTRAKTEIEIPDGIVEKVQKVRADIEEGVIELKFELTPERYQELSALIASIEANAFKNYRKAMGIKAISRLANIPHSRLENALKPSVSKRKKEVRTLTNHDIDNLLILRERIMNGEIEFTDRHNFQSGKDMNPYKIIVTEDDIKMIKWLRLNSDFTYESLERELELPKGKLSQLSGEVKRTNRQQKPRLDITAIYELMLLVEERIQEIKKQYENFDHEEKDEGRADEVVLILDGTHRVEAHLANLRGPVEREMRRKNKEAA